MGKAMTTNAHFSIGELVHHKLFDYRGVIIDVDPRLMLSDEWYEAVARSRPPKDQPWYRVLVRPSLSRLGLCAWIVVNGRLLRRLCVDCIKHYPWPDHAWRDDDVPGAIQARAGGCCCKSVGD